VNRAANIISAFTRLPFADLDQVTRGGTTLVVAPHPDDESLGCGGFIAESCARQCPPVVVIMTDGTASHPSSPSYPPNRLRLVRERETRNALSVLGLPRERLYFMRLRDSAMPVDGAPFEAAVANIQRLARLFRCKMILAPWLRDPHCDHETTQMMVRSAVRDLAVSIYSYPVWGWLLPPDTMLPDSIADGWRLNIAAHLNAKRRAIASHQSQYSDLINDDPNGFRLPSELLATFDRPYEVFVRTPL
jgi:LmbE family N-acetylglucosaminyl deacetylase